MFGACPQVSPIMTTTTTGQPGNTGVNLHANAGVTLNYETVDAPTQFLGYVGQVGEYQSFTDVENFEDYLMFRPDGYKSIWVPLTSLSWPFSGTAVQTVPTPPSQSTPGYHLATSSNPPASITASPTFVPPVSSGKFVNNSIPCWQFPPSAS
jgi:hypothetical protein